MMKIRDKRKSPRHNAGPPLTYQSFLSGDEHRARGVNHSANGISYEKGAEIKPGSIIYIRREQCPPDCPSGEVCLGCRSVTLATIRWCRKIKTRGAEFYQVGAKYF